jgi:thioredoxin-like negative regulator of GroEL
MFGIPQGDVDRVSGGVMKGRMAGVGLVCFLMGLIVQVGFAQNRKPAFTADMIQGKDANAAASTLLDNALQLAGTGSWERIAVGRAWYLGGDKAKGQQIFDSVTTGKKVASSDWVRIARVYTESNEWDKAKVAFEKVLAMEPDDDTTAIELAGFANVHKDRATADAQFIKVMTKSKSDFWHFVNAGGSYLGVKPQ